MIRAGAEADANRVAGEDGLPLGAEATDGAAAATRPFWSSRRRTKRTRSPTSRAARRRSFRVGDGETLRKILQRAGADTWTARGMIEVGAQHLPRSEPRRRAGSAHHARAFAHPSATEGAGALQHLLRRARSSRHRQRATPPASSSPASRRRSARRSPTPRSTTTTRHRHRASTPASTTPACCRTCRPKFDHEGDEGPRLADRLPPPAAARRCGRVLLRHEGRSAGRTSAGRTALHVHHQRRRNLSLLPLPHARRRRRLLRREGQQLEAVPDAPPGARRRAPRLRLRHALPSAA